MRKLALFLCMLVIMSFSALGAVLTIDSPAAGSVLDTNTVTVEFTVDLAVPPVHVHLQIDDNPYVDLISTAPYTFPGTFADGQHTVHAWMAASNGNRYCDLTQYPDACDSVTFTINTGQVTDADSDGYDAIAFGGDDCNDNDPNVNPGETEIPGNGKDDDCDPSTPDGTPTGLIFTQLTLNDISVDTATCWPGPACQNPAQNINVISDAREDDGGLVSCKLKLFNPSGVEVERGTGWEINGLVKPNCSATIWVKDTPSTPAGKFRLQATVNTSTESKTVSTFFAYGHFKPLIESVEHTPLQPGHNDNVIIDASAFGYHDTLSGKVKYRVNGGAEQQVNMTKSMLDFTANIGKFLPADVVSYQVEIADSVSPTLKNTSAAVQFTVVNSCDVAPLCDNQVGVCAGSVKDVCTDGEWDACTQATYAAHSVDFQVTESICDGKDNDCDGQTDEGFDADGDNYVPEAACSGLSVYDCDDTNANVHPGATEIPFNGVDDDCNPATLDEDCDRDSDGYEQTVPGFCSPAQGMEDCNDDNAAVNPGEDETPYNGVDDDCNPATLDDDLDEDGIVEAADCDDADELVGSTAARDCGVGNVGICTLGTETCTAGSWNDDCDAVMPQNDVCGNGIDEDCNGADKACKSGGSPMIMKGGSPLVMKGGWTGPKTDFLPQFVNAKHYYPDVTAPSLLTMKIDNAGIPVTELEVSVQKASTKVDMMVGAPADPLKASKLGNVFQYLVVEHENLDDSAISGARFKFKVSNDWMKQNGFKAEDIRLYRFTDTWNELETTPKGGNSDFTMFWADAPGLSEFAIAGKKAPAPAPEPVAAPEPQEDVQVVEEIDDSSSKKITSLLVVLGVLVIAIVGYLSLKTPEDDKPKKK